MTSVSCDTVVSCGISVRFQTLSPSDRQVTHALLTRPPLTFIPEGNQSVRLACVRHAASVRPEPGSNSLKIVSQQLSLFKSFLEQSNSLLRHLLTFFNSVFSRISVASFLKLTKNFRVPFFYLVVV